MLDHLVGKYGAVRGPLEMARQAADLARPFSGYATSEFHSCAPVAWGPYAAHVHAIPLHAARDVLAWRDWGADIRGRVARGPLRWAVQAQFYTDPESTPIEDGRREWDSPRLTVGFLELSHNEDPDTVAHDHFDPWMALADHRPLGEIMRARKAAYWRATRTGPERFRGSASQPCPRLRLGSGSRLPAPGSGSRLPASLAGVTDHPTVPTPPAPRRPLTDLVRQ